MFLADIFDQLTYGELAQVSIGGLEEGEIDFSNYPAIVNHINLGLMDLYKRLPLRFEEVHIQQYSHLQNYHLQSAYAISNIESTEPVKYLMDSEFQPFKDNVIRIEQVFSEEGEERPLNDTSETWSVYTPNPKTVLIPFNDENNTFSVIYRASHDKIIIDREFDPTNIEIQLPEFLLEPLLIYVAGRVVGNMGSSDSLNASSHYVSRYELALQQVDYYNLVDKGSLHNDRLERNGWV